jgi:signal transduction histidine kinase
MSISALDKTKINGFNKNIVDNISNLITESISALRNTSNNLSPHILESFGLISALKAFVDNISLLGTLDISFSYNIENIRFDEQVEINLYRVICELFQNTIKHWKQLIFADDHF